jgi:prepilin peptidase CpaA
MNVFIALAVAIAAAIYDFKTYRIPNWLTLGAVLLGLLLSLAGHGAEGGLFGSVKGVMWGAFPLIPLFLIGAMGGGDVKLAGAFGALGGTYLAVNTLLIGSIIGGLMAAAFLLRAKGLSGAVKSVHKELVHLALMGSEARPDKETAVIPYGVALSFGAMLALLFKYLEGGYIIYGG